MPTTIEGSVGIDKIKDNSVVTADIADLNVTKAKLSPDVVPLGVDQTWQDVTGSRAVNTVYTNTTGRPITIEIYAGNNTAGMYNAITVVHNAVTTVHRTGYAYGANAYMSQSVIIPSGATYTFSPGAGVATIGIWLELR